MSDWPREYPPKDAQAITDGLCCEWVLRGAGLLPAGDITPEQITGQS